MLTEAQIKELVESSLSEMLPAVLKESFAEFRTYFDGKLTETVAPLKETLDSIEFLEDEEDAPKGKDSTEVQELREEIEDVATNDPLSKRLKVLEAKLAEAEAKEAQRIKEAEQRAFQDTIAKAISSKGNVMLAPVVQELLTNRLGSGYKVTEDGQFVAKDGRTIDEVVGEFFGTDEGQHFLPSNHKNGLGTTKGYTPAPQNLDPNTATLDEMLASGFL